MEKVLIVVDMQNDFVDGTLGTQEAEAIIENVVFKINKHEGSIYATYDTHFEDYMDTKEGEKLPVSHCVKGTTGWKLNYKVQAALEKKPYCKVEKYTFGSVDLPGIIKENHDINQIEIELIGLCTDICVVSNALLLKAHFPEITIKVDSTCCAGVTKESHKAALRTMEMCQIDII